MPDIRQTGGMQLRPSDKFAGIPMHPSDAKLVAKAEPVEPGDRDDDDDDRDEDEDCECDKLSKRARRLAIEESIPFADALVRVAAGAKPKQAQLLKKSRRLLVRDQQDFGEFTARVERVAQRLGISRGEALAKMQRQ